MVTSLFGLQKAQDIVAGGNRHGPRGDAQDAGAGRAGVHRPEHRLHPRHGRAAGSSPRPTSSTAPPSRGCSPGPPSSRCTTPRPSTRGSSPPATMILDAPVVFTNADGTLYEPLNYKGEWHGRVLLRDALAESMNVPSLKVLDGIGFDAAIQRASRHAGRHATRRRSTGASPATTPSAWASSTSPPSRWCARTPSFANGGREVEPVSIRYIEDRNGKIIMEPAKETLARESRKGDAAQIMSPQTAYIMTSILQSTIKEGTLGGPGQPAGHLERQEPALCREDGNHAELGGRLDGRLLPVRDHGGVVRVRRGQPVPRHGPHRRRHRRPHVGQLHEGHPQGPAR